MSWLTTSLASVLVSLFTNGLSLALKIWDSKNTDAQKTAKIARQLTALADRANTAANAIVNGTKEEADDALDALRQNVKQ